MIIFSLATLQQEKVEREERLQLQAAQEILVKTAELEENKRQNDIAERAIALEEEKMKIDQEVKIQEGVKYNEKQMCLTKQLNVIYPYYGYNDDALQTCLKIMAEHGTFTLNECQKKFKDRIAELEQKEDRARIDCGL